jgi:hypothetical protein
MGLSYYLLLLSGFDSIQLLIGSLNELSSKQLIGATRLHTKLNPAALLFKE